MVQHRVLNNRWQVPAAPQRLADLLRSRLQQAEQEIDRRGGIPDQATQQRLW
jgi:hypothetical protein